MAKSRLQGKGFPDLATREFLRIVSTSGAISPKNDNYNPNGTYHEKLCHSEMFPVEESSDHSAMKVDRTAPNGSTCLPIYALVDNDPHGIHIFSVYKSGSAAMAHESHRLAVDSISLLGICQNDLTLHDSNESGDGRMLQLTLTDRRKAVDLLGKEQIWSEKSLRVELQRMLFSNMKGEIQSMDCLPGGLEGYLNRRLTELVVHDSQSLSSISNVE